MSAPQDEETSATPTITAPQPTNPPTAAITASEPTNPPSAPVNPAGITRAEEATKVQNQQTISSATATEKRDISATPTINLPDSKNPPTAQDNSAKSTEEEEAKKLRTNKPCPLLLHQKRSKPQQPLTPSILLLHRTTIQHKLQMPRTSS